MAITLENGHRWSIGQTYGRLPDNLDGNLPAPGKTWFAVIVDNTTGRPVVKSALAATEAEAIADAETQYTRR